MSRETGCGDDIDDLLLEIKRLKGCLTQAENALLKIAKNGNEKEGLAKEVHKMIVCEHNQRSGDLIGEIGRMERINSNISSSPT